MKEQPSQDVETTYYQQSEDELKRIGGKKTQVQQFADATRRDPIVQIYVLVKHDRVVVPSLSRPKPNPAWPTNERADEDQKDPHQKAPAKHANRETPLPECVVAIAQRI